MATDQEIQSTPRDVPDEDVVPALVREDLVEQALPWLDQIAGTVAWQLNGRIPVDDLRSLGHFAITDLVRRYDPELAPFEPFMRMHLRWAILDGIRRQTHMRAIHGRARALVASEHLAQLRHESRLPPASTSMPPSEQAYGHRLRMVMRNHAVAMGISLMQSGGQEVATAPSSGTPERATFRRARFEELRAAVDALPDETLRELIDRHYFQGRPLSAVAKELRISKSWASRLHAQAIEILGQRLRGTNADPRSSTR